MTFLKLFVLFPTTRAKWFCAQGFESYIRRVPRGTQDGEQMSRKRRKNSLPKDNSSGSRTTSALQIINDVDGSKDNKSELGKSELPPLPAPPALPPAVIFNVGVSPSGLRLEAVMRINGEFFIIIPSRRSDPWSKIMVPYAFEKAFTVAKLGKGDHAVLVIAVDLGDELEDDDPRVVASIDAHCNRRLWREILDLGVRRAMATG